jgi:hypothetical protein
MNKQDPFAEESEEVRRLRRVRQELWGRFKTTDELFDWLRTQEKQDAARRYVRRGLARASKKARPAVRNGKPAHGNTVRR